MQSFMRLAAAAVLLCSTAGSAAAQVPDHLQCFKIKDELAKATYLADITPDDLTFPAATGCAIRVPAKLLCVDAVKSNVDPAPPGAADGADAQKYLCYKAKCPKTEPTAELTDQFGTHSLTVKSTSLLCAPIPEVATCTDLDQNGNETGVDCGGGSCPPCSDGEGCNVASDCLSNTCVSGVCVTLASNGSPCSLNNQCSSNNCVDGFCCNTACNSLCEACSAAKKGSGMNGACGNIVVGTDPDAECATQAAATCGTNGSCSGAGSCALYAPGTVCATGSCTGSTQNNDDICNGMGVCQDGGSTSCAPYICNMGNSCLTTCGNDSQCTSGNYCSGGSCVPKQTDGAACLSSGQCLSGNCVDGFCCNSACSGLCQACSDAKKGGGGNGTCGNIGAGLDPDNECAGVSTCNGMATCNP